MKCIHKSKIEGENQGLTRRNICYGCLQPMGDRVTGDRNQSQHDQKEVTSNITGHVKCASTLEKVGSKVISMCFLPVSIKYENSGWQANKNICNAW